MTSFNPPFHRRLFRFLQILTLLPLVCLLFVTGCTTGKKRLPDSSTTSNYPIGYVEEGVASWYGPGFHGNLTANGERYDMYGITAAHRTLPLGSVLQVRSLTTGRQVKVRVNDRGPFAKGRILDLSLGAAKVLQMTQRGTDRVSLKVIDYLGPLKPGERLVVQVGSFRDKSRASTIKNMLTDDYAPVRIVKISIRGERFYRVLVGTYRNEKRAQAMANRLSKRFHLQTLVVRDDIGEG